MQQCYLFATYGGNLFALGKVNGTLANNVYSGSVTLTPPLAGTYNLAVTCGGVESGFATLTANLNPTTATFTATPSPQVGQPTTLQATVTSPSGTPTGSVNFNLGSIVLATVPLTNGVATLPVPTGGLPAQAYPLTATYTGSGTYAASASSVYNLVLAAAPTVTTLSSSASSLTAGTPITFTATVARSANGATGTPTGTVSFSSYGNVLGTAAVNSAGEASITFPPGEVGAGTYPIVARYSGDGGDTASASTAQNVTVLVASVRKSDRRER